MNWYRLVVFIHVLGAIIWVGGILFLGFVAVPSVRQLPDQDRSRLLDIIGRRFRLLGYTVLAVLLVTGVIQSVRLGATVTNVLDGSFFSTRFGSALGTKLLLVLAMTVVSVLHDFFVGPAAVRALSEGRSAVGLRKTASWLARVTAVLAILVVFYAVKMVR